MDHLAYHNGSKVVSKFEKYYLSWFPDLSHSPDINPCDFWLFAMLKETVKDRDFNSSDELEVMIGSAWNGLDFDDVQSVFHN
jgi:hypothetical protein